MDLLEIRTHSPQMLSSGKRKVIDYLVDRCSSSLGHKGIVDRGTRCEGYKRNRWIRGAKEIDRCPLAAIAKNIRHRAAEIRDQRARYQPSLGLLKSIDAADEGSLDSIKSVGLQQEMRPVENEL